MNEVQKKLKKETKKGKSIKKKKIKGISLIALVVTIIVLIILAGIALVATFGENGLIAKTKQAEYNAKKAEIITELKTFGEAKSIDKVAKGEKYTQANFIEDIENDHRKEMAREYVVSTDDQDVVHIKFLDVDITLDELNASMPANLQIEIPEETDKTWTVIRVKRKNGNLPAIIRVSSSPYVNIGVKDQVEVKGNWKRKTEGESNYSIKWVDYVADRATAIFKVRSKDIRYQNEINTKSIDEVANQQYEIIEYGEIDKIHISGGDDRKVSNIRALNPIRRINIKKANNLNELDRIFNYKLKFQEDSLPSDILEKGYVKIHYTQHMFDNPNTFDEIQKTGGIVFSSRYGPGRNEKDKRIVIPSNYFKGKDMAYVIAIYWRYNQMNVDSISGLINLKKLIVDTNNPIVMGAFRDNKELLYLDVRYGRNPFSEDYQIFNEEFLRGNTSLKKLSLVLDIYNNKNDYRVHFESSPLKHATGLENIEMFGFRQDDMILQVPDDIVKYNTKLKTIGRTKWKWEAGNIPADTFKNNLELKEIYTTLNTINIPEDLFSNNINLTKLENTFKETGIESIPGRLFANNSKIEELRSVFENTSIAEIPSNLFANTPKLKNIYKVFKNTKLVGIPDNLFGSASQYLNSMEGAFENTLITELPQNFKVADEMRYTFKGTKLNKVPLGLINSRTYYSGYSWGGIFEGTKISEIPEEFINELKEYDRRDRGVNPSTSRFRGMFKNTPLTYNNVAKGADDKWHSREYWKLLGVN